MKAIELLRAKLKEQHPDAIPGINRVILPKARIEAFFDEIGMPALHQIEAELRDRPPMQVTVSRHVSTARILINDGSSSFLYRITISNRLGHLQIDFRYQDRLAGRRAGKGSQTDNEMINYICEQIELSEYEKADVDYLIEKFIECYFNREALAAEVIRQRREDEAAQKALSEEADREEAEEERLAPAVQMNGEDEADDLLDKMQV